MFRSHKLADVRLRAPDEFGNIVGCSDRGKVTSCIHGHTFHACTKHDVIMQRIAGLDKAIRVESVPWKISGKRASPNGSGASYSGMNSRLTRARATVCGLGVSD